ncbi:MAG: ABC transporter substrate-binding protein [Betaproteobacteria bacterium]|nr:ABC transporter substrate-binding protein [Betaproteobacteria bacterium]MBI2958992.1 ABC transporter substrate-binding protein [Betaproteobacteria bacterium]
MIARRHLLVVLGIGMLAGSMPDLAQPGKVWRIGFLSPASAAGARSRVEAFRAGLRELGYVEGRNIAVEFRYAGEKYERLPALAAELAQLKVDVLVTHSGAGARAAKDATATIPIVFAAVGDPVASGLVESLARPGGNITGLTFFAFDLYAKRIELLAEILPRVKRVAFLLNPDSPLVASAIAATEDAVKPLKVELLRFAARNPGEFESAFSAMAKRGVDAVAVQEESVFLTNTRSIAQLAAKRRLPVASGVAFADAGSLLGYGPDLLALFHRSAYFVDRILKGAKPGELPIERPTRFELVVNSRTAKQIGVTIPSKVLARADRVIE